MRSLQTQTGRHKPGILDCGGKRSATPLSDRSNSGVALRLPPQSKRYDWQFLTLFLLLAFRFTGVTADHPEPIRDMPYAKIGDLTLSLDLYLPERKPRSPLIVWVHGGAWRSGSKASMPLKKLVADGYAIAGVDYRLSTQAKFPAQIHDLKAAIRFLRAQAGEWHLPDKVLIAGDSAGGHLAALVGVSNGNAELEGEVGDERKQSSKVQAIISFYGGSDLTTILKQSTPHGLSVRVPALDLFLGGQPEAVPDLARKASPVFYVDKKSPPLLLLHGDQDPQMPVNQPLELWGAYKKAKAPVQLEIVPGAAHGGPMFYDDERLAVVKNFLKKHF